MINERTISVLVCCRTCYDLPDAARMLSITAAKSFLLNPRPLAALYHSVSHIATSDEIVLLVSR